MPKTGEGSKLKRFLFHNQSTAQTIAKNTFWLSFGEIFGRLLRVGLIFYAARVLGAAGYGAFSYMTSLAGILTIFSDMGLSAILIREGAKGEETRRAYFATSLLIKLVMIILTFVIIVLVTPRVTTIPLSPALIYAIGLLSIFDTLRVFGNAVFRSEERMQLEAGTNILTQFTILIVGLYVLAFIPSPENLAMAYAIGSAIGLLLVLYLIKRYFRDVFKFFRRDLIKVILTAGWPIGFSAIFGGLLVNIDTVMIGWFMNAEQVGYYSAAQKPIAFQYLLPAFIVGGLLPVMARYAKDNKEKFREVMERGLSMTILLAYPLVAGITLNASKIVEIVYGMEFINAATSMTILAFTLLIPFPGTMIINAIFAFDRQKELIPMWIIGSTLNVALNFYLIPILGAPGSAFASLLTQMLITGLLWRKMWQINHFRVIKHTTSIIKATALMILGILTMNGLGTPFALMTLASMIIYFGALIFFKDATLQSLITVVEGLNDTKPHKT